jgi:hypothetical protein
MKNHVRRFAGALVFVVLPAIFIETSRIADIGDLLVDIDICLLLVVPGILLVGLLFAPMGYTVSSANVTVNRLGRNLVISRASIDGFCGSYGLFYSSGLGIFRAYVTNSASLVLITLKGTKKIVLSPESPDEFIWMVAIIPAYGSAVR